MNNEKKYGNHMYHDDDFHKTSASFSCDEEADKKFRSNYGEINQREYSKFGATSSLEYNDSDYDKFQTSPKVSRDLGTKSKWSARDFSRAESGKSVLKIDINTFQRMLEIGLQPAESGGMFGRNEDDPNNVVCEYCFDETSACSCVTFTPNIQVLNKELKTWNKIGVRLSGFVHSHPGTMGTPSMGDLIYAQRILDYNPDMEVLWLPIINTIPDMGVLSFTPWSVVRDKGKGFGSFLRRSQLNVRDERGRVMIVSKLDLEGAKREIKVGVHRFLVEVNVPLQVVRLTDDVCSSGSTRTTIRQTHETSKLEEQFPSSNKTSNMVDKANFSEPKSSVKSNFNKATTFDRVTTVYDLEAMRNSRLVVVGVGGAADFVETMARVGVEQFVIIDPDSVSETNLATQQTYRKDIGRSKVECVKERILDVNPDAKVDARQNYLDDFSDAEMEVMLNGDLQGRQTKRTILCGFTDSFPAQARVNRLALKYGVPSLCAQVYREGRGAEITFTYPGVTPACHRCILSSRYRYYAEGNKNNVVSNGTPFFATTRLNALKGFVILAMLHYGTNHRRWGKTLEQIGDRNLLQIRMAPNFGEEVFGNPDFDPFEQVFAKANNDFLFFDETIWKREIPESIVNGHDYDCPDCGGSGRLTDAIGKCADTRIDPIIYK